MLWKEAIKKDERKGRQYGLKLLLTREARSTKLSETEVCIVSYLDVITNNMKT